MKIDERTFQFALLIIEVYKDLQSKKEYVLSKQLLRSGTSIGANVEEAQAAQSRRDFIARRTIASKEARETRYWIRLLDAAGYLEDFSKKNALLDEIGNIVNIIIKIVKTSTQTAN